MEATKTAKPRTRACPAHIRTRSRHLEFLVRDVVPRDGEVEGPSLFQGRRMWPQASRIRRPWGPASGSFGGLSNGGLGLGKLYRGRGLGLAGEPQMGVEVLQIGGFMVGK